MSHNNLSIRGGAFALLVTFAIAGVQPAIAEPALTAPVSPSYGARVVEAPVIHRHRHAQRSTVRDAYGSYVRGDNGVPAAPSYGYGVGDNSRNQTW